ncbi:hypothetical protein ABZV93_17490 [Actinopolymorpha sp. NPDC004070]|uniref:hypothetical protein n=1 Tax=Actinopolymorpha sp. NPDC004070 TaxID=3154548 RepID=UPI0033B0AF51
MNPPDPEVPRLAGDPGQRLAFADRIRATLAEAVPGSVAELRGSLASGSADVYSDVDLGWVVPDDRFGAALGCVSTALATVGPLASFRSDPDNQRSPHLRRLFVRFAGVPLSWRLDLEVWAASVAYDAAVADDPSMRGDEWCPYESALMNALAAIKQLLRGGPEIARDGLTRGFERVGAEPRLDLSSQDRVIELAHLVAAARPHLRSFATDIITAAIRELA